MMIITDTGSDILESEAQEMELEMVPIDIAFGEEHFLRNTEESFLQFYELLEQNKELPSTSQPSPEAFFSLYEKAKENNEDVLVITLSQKLSGTYNCALLAKDICGYEHIYVIDSRHAMLSERIVVEYALSLRGQGITAATMVPLIKAFREKVMLTGVPETLLYLKKGGRIPPVLASFGTLLNIKPVLWIKDGLVSNLEKVRGMKAAQNAMQQLIAQYGRDEAWPVYFGYSKNRKPVEDFLSDTKEKYEIRDTRLLPIGGTIGTHIGPNAIAMAFVKQS